MSMNETEIQKILTEIKVEQHTSPFKEDSELLDYINEGIFDINEAVGYDIDYATDLKARSLLKDYVLYSDHKRKSEFRKLNEDEYAYLQTKYYQYTDVQ